MTGAAIASAVTGVGGLAMGAKAGRDAKGAQDAQLAMQMRAFDELVKSRDFSQGMLDDWEASFGGIQDNLTNYYQNLDPTKFATQGKQELYANIDKQMQQMNDTLASQGLMTSGMRAQAEKEAAFAKATGAAGIDLQAPEMVNQMQRGYFNENKDTRNLALQGVLGSYGNAASQFNSISNTYGQNAAIAGQSQAGWMNMAGNMFGSAIGLGIEGYKPKPIQGPPRQDGSF